MYISLLLPPDVYLDLMERKTVSLSTIRNVVMDEADEMLNMGFTESINAILADVPKERNTLLFSATMSPEIARISKIISGMQRKSQSAAKTKVPVM